MERILGENKIEHLVVKVIGFKEIFPEECNLLNRAGIHESQATIIMASGVHRRNTQEERIRIKEEDYET